MACKTYTHLDQNMELWSFGYWLVSFSGNRSEFEPGSEVEIKNRSSDLCPEICGSGSGYPDIDLDYWVCSSGCGSGFLNFVLWIYISIYGLECIDLTFWILSFGSKCLVVDVKL